MKTDFVIPGIKYGNYGEMIPSCRSVDTMITWLLSSAVIKLPKDILDTDKCQRGPTGKPLSKVTPLVPFVTLKEWQEKAVSANKEERS